MISNSTETHPQLKYRECLYQTLGNLADEDKNDDQVPRLPICFINVKPTTAPTTTKTIGENVEEETAKIAVDAADDARTGNDFPPATASM